MADNQLAFPFAVEDERRMMPTEFIGASLFSALNRSAKPIYLNKLTEIARLNSYRLVYRGRVLTQAHADVWMAIIELFRQRGTALHGVAEFRAGEMLRILDREPHIRSRADLFEWINDMIACQVHLYEPGDSTRVWLGGLLTGEMDGGVPLVDIIRRINEGKPIGEIRYRLMLHPQMREAFVRGYTGLEWSQRRSIGKNELALWLHQYLTAYRAPVRIEDLQLLSWQGRAGNDPKNVAGAASAAFRHRLRKAVRKLTQLKLIRKWKIDDHDRLCTLMPPQARTPRLAP